MPLFVELSAVAQTQYANLAQAARQGQLRRSIADLPGGFVTKTIKSQSYWYFQFKTLDRKPQQVYIGPDDDATRALLAVHNNPEATSARQHLVDLCEAVAALGCYSVIPKHARVLARLADHGLFRAGGVLVGTHAFLSYQNRFGIRWTGGDTTVDLDFAHPGKNISLALNPDVKIDGHAAIESLKMGFLPVNEGTRYVKQDEPDFDLDFLTCQHRGGQAPLAMPMLNLTLQPLRFMEYSMQDPVVDVLVSSSGPIVVNLPRPERYALAKLLIYPDRLSGAQPEKANKDLRQAASLIEFLSQNHQEALKYAWQDLQDRGPAWRRQVSTGVEALLKRHPALESMVAAFA